MLLSPLQLNQLGDIALKAVTLAANYINGVDRSMLTTHFKNSGSSLSAQVVTEVDITCQAIIIKQLQESCDRFDIALLSEENCSDTVIDKHKRLNKDYFWCIDPLDGTLPFIEGRDGYAVSVALVAHSGQAIIGAICLPATNQTYQTKLDPYGKTTVYKNAQLIEDIPALSYETLFVYCDQSFLNSASYAPLLKKLSDAVTCVRFKSIKGY